jgi:heptosyltransferase II
LREKSKPKLLIFELWGVGDVVLAATLIDAAREDFEIHLVAKPFARDLVNPTYPEVSVHPLVAGWTAHYGKYQLWKWRWRDLLKAIVDLRREHFDIAISVRPDPRDHFLMWLIGARKRIGFPLKGSGIFLHESLFEPPQKWHRVESYREIGRRVGLTKIDNSSPRLTGANYRTERINALLNSATKPIVCAHLGPEQWTRLWPEKYWRETLQRLRNDFDFHLVLVSENNFGSSLHSLADASISALNIRELVDLVSRSALLLCHDSGPMHVAAACGVPTIAMFGPGEERWFRPWGDDHTVIRRDICPYKPCFDFCRFDENICLTQLQPGEVWSSIKAGVQRVLQR